MRIEDLDEFEGLTADMVRDWLRAKGWELKPTEMWMVWQKGDQQVADCLLDTPRMLSCLAEIERLSPQSLLREINPRMRPGWPTEEERARHPIWMAEGPAGTIMVGRFVDCGEFGLGLRSQGGAVLTEGYAERWSFWPCDAHGNKVRRGTVG